MSKQLILLSILRDIDTLYLDACSAIQAFLFCYYIYSIKSFLILFSEFFWKLMTTKCSASKFDTNYNFAGKQRLQITKLGYHNICSLLSVCINH